MTTCADVSTSPCISLAVTTQLPQTERLFVRNVMEQTGSDNKRGRCRAQVIRGPASLLSTGGTMKLLLMCALLAMTAAKRRQVSQNQVVTGASNPDALTPELPVDYHFEYRSPQVTNCSCELFESDTVAEQQEGRQAVDNLWPDGNVSYAISSSLAVYRNVILAGIQQWSDHTCVEFKEVAEGSRVPHIKVISGTACQSWIGKIVSSGGQDLSLSLGCASQLGTVVHEFGHALGLHHQQSRNDRDAYVTILSENIREGHKKSFQKRDMSKTYSVPYDLTSIMHYPSDLFSKNGQDTIRVNNFLHQHLIDLPSNSPSHRDKQIVNAMYGCAAGCRSPPTCRNGGFVGKNCKCVCPPNASGRKCGTSSGSYYGDIDCGDIEMTKAGTITSPNYPNNFPKNVVCWWVIKAPAGKRVKVTITDMDMLYRWNGVCPWDHLALRYTGDVYTDNQKACASELQGKSFTSTGRQFIIQFKSGNYGWDKGFSAKVRFVA